MCRGRDAACNIGLVSLIKKSWMHILEAKREGLNNARKHAEGWAEDQAAWMEH